MQALPPDGHVHTEWSWDAVAGSMERSCARAVELGLPSIAFTDHADYTRWGVTRENRQADALAVYQSVRRALFGELGVEPGRGLQELQQRILDADPGLSLAGGEPVGHVATLPPREPQPVVPRQLPAAVAYFAGRDRELKALSRFSTSVQAAARL